MDGYGDSGNFGDETGLFDAVPTLMVVLTVFFFVGFVLTLVLILFIWVRGWRAFKDAGLDPLAAPAQLAGQLANSELLAAEKSTEARLQELEDLHTRGVISDEEHRAARAAALTDG